MVNHRSESASSTIKDLISQLRSTFFATDFENASKKLIEREEHMKKEYDNLKKKTETLEKKHVDELKKKDTEIDELKKLNSEYETKIRVSEKRFLDLNVRVLSLGKLGKELTSQKQNNPPPPAESSKQPLVSEKKDLNIRTEPKFPEIIQLDDDDDDNRECISTLKRKKVSNEMKKEYSSDDDDDTECIAILRRKRVSKETNGDSNEDFIDKIPTGTQKSKNLDELHSQSVTYRPLSTPSSVKNKPVLKKHKPKNHVFSLDCSDNSSSDENTKKIDKAYMSLVARMKKPKERWESEAHMVKEFEKDDELCMNAICALHRQRIILYGPDISTMHHLARFLIDGDPQGKLKKKASELNQFDREEFRMFARKYASQIFGIYETKKDPFFPPSRS